MKGNIFFYFSFTFLFSIIGYIIDSYFNIKEYEIIKNLKGPWDLNVGLSIMLGFFVYYIFTKIWKFKPLEERSFFQTIIDMVVILINSLIFSIFIIHDYKYEISISTSILFYLFLYPNIYILYTLCKRLFSNKNRVSEQYFLIFIILIPYILVILDVVFLIKSIIPNLMLYFN